MKSAVPRIARCAIYTRKSTEHNLDLEFNSLDAQREACEAYIKSQAHEGWRLVPARYDDGGLSGASLDRPALQTLLADVRSGKIDIIVVYKVDRLTRSLADFAKLVELFDAHAASFVSVTQSFNTTTSMGRLTLNVLLSFAQFEREVIGERVRDKIAASKRKGMWVGGTVSLGYAVSGKKPVVVPEEADTVRLIFRRYLAVGSIGALSQELDRDGVRSRRQVLSNGRVRGGQRFGTGALFYLLKNRFYVGDIVYRGEVHRGYHQSIIDLPLFEAVQAKLAANAVDRRLRLKGSPAILTGRIFDDRGNRMTPTHANKRGVRYRYYVSHALLQKRAKEAGSVARVPAPEIESMVAQALRAHLADTKAEVPNPTTDRDLIEDHAERVILRRDAVELHIGERTEVQQGDGVHEGWGAEEVATNGSASRNGASVVLHLPWSAQNLAAVKGILHAPSDRLGLKPETRDGLLVAIAKARNWIDDLVEGRAASLAEIAAREGKIERHIRNLAALAFVSPSIVAAIVTGSAPASLTVTSLAQALPCCWAAQEQLGRFRH